MPENAWNEDVGAWGRLKEAHRADAMAPEVLIPGQSMALLRRGTTILNNTTANTHMGE